MSVLCQRAWNLLWFVCEDCEKWVFPWKPQNFKYGNQGNVVQVHQQK